MLQGDFFTLGLPEVLQIIGGQRKTGMLTVVTADAENTIYFQDGKVILTQEQHDRYLLNKYFANANPRAEGTFKMLLAEHHATGKPVGQIMVSLGAIKQEELDNELQRQTEEQLYSLFSWIDGAFNFIEVNISSVGQVAYAIDTVDLVVNAARQVDEWRNIRALLPNTDSLVKAKPGIDRNALKDEAAGALDLIPAEGVTLKELCAKSGANELETCRAVVSLIQTGAVEIIPAVPADVAAGNNNTK